MYLSKCPSSSFVQCRNAGLYCSTVLTICLQAAFPLYWHPLYSQAGTSHNLGTNFAKAFDITYLADTGERLHVHQSSWGLSTRMIGKAPKLLLSQPSLCSSHPKLIATFKLERDSFDSFSSFIVIFFFSYLSLSSCNNLQLVWGGLPR